MNKIYVANTLVTVLVYQRLFNRKSGLGFTAYGYFNMFAFNMLNGFSVHYVQIHTILYDIRTAAPSIWHLTSGFDYCCIVNNRVGMNLNRRANAEYVVMNRENGSFVPDPLAGYDGGDCCEQSCVRENYVCGGNWGYDCVDPDYAETSYSYGFGCDEGEYGNGYCNPENNKEECGGFINLLHYCYCRMLIEYLKDFTEHFVWYCTLRIYIRARGV